MDFTAPQYELARSHLRDDTGTQREAPLVVLGALLQLLGTESPVASLCANIQTSREGTTWTSWRAAWLTKERFLYVCASKQLGSWKGSDVHEGEQTPDEFESWSRPLRDIERLAVEEAHLTRLAKSGEWSWNWRYSVSFGPHDKIELPLFGQLPSQQAERSALDTFWSALRDR